MALSNQRPEFKKILKENGTSFSATSVHEDDVQVGFLGADGFSVALRPHIHNYYGLLRSHIAPVRMFEFSVALRPQRPSLLRILGTGAQDGHLDFHTAPEL